MIKSSLSIRWDIVWKFKERAVKISEKIFLTVVIVLGVSFSIAGYILMSAYFSNGYKQAEETAFETNQLLTYTLQGYLSQAMTNQEMTKNDLLKEIENSLQLFADVDVEVLILDESGEELYRDADVILNQESFEVVSPTRAIASGIRDDRKAKIAGENSVQHYIQVVGVLKFEENFYQKIADMQCKTWYIITHKNISYLYEAREQQLKVYNRVLLVLFFVFAICSFFLARMVVKPISKISRTARVIAGGDLSLRITQMKKDEIGNLAQNFNRMADSLEAKILELEEAARRQEEFVGNFTHELKTPMTSIIGYADLMRSDENVSEMGMMCAGYIYQEGKRLESLSHRLLQLIVLDNQEIDRKKCSIKKLVEEVVQMTGFLLEKEKITINVEVEDCSLFLDWELMKTVVMNLIDNARKAVDEKGKIRIVGKKKPAGYLLAVCDNGKGIPAEQINKITDAFYMVDKSRSRKMGGAGLGLSICLKIVELHHGKIKIFSNLGKGTKVAIFFPYHTKS